MVESQAVVERLVEELPSAIRRESPLVNRAKKTTTVVYRVIDGKAVCTPVKPGPTDLTHTVITAGVEVGVEVIVGPYKVLESIDDGELVRDEMQADEGQVDEEQTDQEQTDET